MFIPHILRDLSDGVSAELPKLTRATAAGIAIAIAGNILISLALNCQKLAHQRLERDRELEDIARSRSKSISREASSTSTDTITARATDAPIHAIAHIETEPLLAPGESSPPRGWWARRFSNRSAGKHEQHANRPSIHALMPVDILPIAPNGPAHSREPTEEGGDANEGDYLKSKLWWLGFLLMNVGESGNFISYAFAPASIVAPLGTFALIANCFLAPLMLGERFRKRDVLGIIIAVIGAITVVLSSNSSDTRLDPKALIAAITQRPFIVYTIVYVVGIIFLSGLSEGGAGKRVVFVDVGLCALFGGFTVLSTKALSTLLTMEWLEIFTEWITYPVIIILLGTGIGQIKYLNRALMRFDSKLVVPTQFVMFNLSAIVGSAILYGDFRQATFHQLVTFLYGCAATFAGVFIIAWAPASANPTHFARDEEDDEEAASSAIAATDDGESLPRNVRMGSLARRNQATLIIPEGATPRPTPLLRNRQSLVSMYGFSPAQRALLLSSLQDDMPSPTRGFDSETPSGSPGRRRAISWIEDGYGSMRGTRAAPRYGATANFGTRDSSMSRSPDASRSRSGSRG